MPLRSALLAAALVLAGGLPGLAATHYVAPLGAKPECATADGSQACPWPTLGGALANAKVAGGDVILLMDGSHGHVRTNRSFDKEVVVQSQTGSNAHLNSIHFSDKAKNITLKNLRIWRMDGDEKGFMVRSYSGATNLKFENLDIRSRPDTDDQLKWTPDRWRAVAGVGMELRGKGYTVRDCRVSAVHVGIFAVGPGAMVEKNTVTDFTGDGLKSGGSNSTFRANLIENRFKVSDTHADGFQAYAATVLSNLVIDGNVILEWTHAKTHPLRGTLQGIGMFNGYYDNVVIQNNVVATRHYHGIAVQGARNSRIVNNTVVNIDGSVAKAPWIRLVGKSSTEPSQNVIVANNLAMQYQGASDAANKVVFTDNSVILYPAKVMTDLAGFNYTPTTASGFINSANAAHAPALDIRGTARPQGPAPDRGAVEVTGTTALPLTGRTTVAP